MNWDVFIAYGAFKEPTKEVNFIVVRMPTGRVPWAKKVYPAIKQVTRPWFAPGVDRKVYIMGEPLETWDTKAALRYEWDGTSLKEVK